MAALSDNGMVHIATPYSVPETLSRVEALLKKLGIAIFARVDHGGEAQKAGFEMRPTELLIFGSPKQGTPLMIASPTLAIDLPLKALVWQDAAGQVWLSYNSPAYLQQRHAIPEDLLKNIAGLGPLLQKSLE